MTQTTAGDRPRILLVDDSRLIRRAVTKVLAEDVEITEADDGETGWQMLQDDDGFEVVISDLSMPGLDGFGLIQRIRSAERPRLKSLPVIIITGAEDDEDTRREALQRGATDFVTKPFDPVELRARVSAHIRLSQATQRVTEISMALESQSVVDPLTHLANERHFLQRARRELSLAKRHGGELAAIRLGVDNLHALARTHGNETAARLLRSLGKLLAGEARAEDTVAHLGGGRFAILVPFGDRSGATTMAERLLGLVRGRPLEAGSRVLQITLSGGVACADVAQDSSIDAALAVAERRMQRAMKSGGDRLAIDDAQSVPPSASRAVGAVRPIPLDVERALQLIAAGQAQSLRPELPAMLRRLEPLLRLCDEQLELGWAAALDAIPPSTPSR